MLVAVAMSLALAGGVQSASASPEAQVAPLTCVSTARRLLETNPAWKDIGPVPPGGAARISFDTTLTLKFEDESEARLPRRLSCIADVTARRIVSAKIDGVEYLTTPLSF
ncbi:hypothetical protein [Brevundimonas sp.]|jgi:hypothetical protein|uniref:hypothetical protein n=1 Tax=Brevundimonas sp. TaxID=1871086 RepID=UPI003568D01E